MTGAGDSRATPRHPRQKTGSDSSARAWWDWHLFGLWILVNGLAFIVLPLAGTALEQLASLATKDLVQDNRAGVVLIIAVIGASFQGLVVGRWQWRLLQRRVADLQRRRWVMATLVPAFAVWLLAIAPQAADMLAKGGSTLIVFREGFIQALVLGPLIGLSQAAALRGHTSRWAWWFAANVTTYLSGAALHELGVWLKHEWSLPAPTTTFFPLVAFAIHGAWMLWVTAPQAASHQVPTAASRPLPHQPDARAVAAHPRQRRLRRHRDGAHRPAHHRHRPDHGRVWLLPDRRHLRAQGVRLRAGGGRHLGRHPGPAAPGPGVYEGRRRNRQLVAAALAVPHPPGSGSNDLTIRPGSRDLAALRCFVQYEDYHEEGEFR